MYFEPQKSLKSNMMEVQMPGYLDTQTQIGVKTEMIVTPHQDIIS